MSALLLTERASTAGRSLSRWLRRGGVRRRLLLFLVLIAVAIAVLPTIVAKTPLRNALLAAAVPSDHLRVRAGGASLGWFRAPSVTAVEVKDTAGATLLGVDSIRMDRTLLALLVRRGDLGTIEIERPTLHVVTRPDGSNLEDALGQLIADLRELADDEPDDDAARARVRVAVRLVDGTIVGEDATTGRRWRVQAVAGNYDANGAGALDELSLSGELVDVGAAEARSGQFAISLRTTGDERQQLAWQVEGLVLAAVEPWLRRWVAAAEMSGTLAGEGAAAWRLTDSLPAEFTTSGALRVDRLDAAAPWLAGDRVRLARIELPWRIAVQPAGLEIEDLRLVSDVGQVAVRGLVDPAALAHSAGFDAESLLDAAARQDVELHGSLDLAKLAAMLPRALRIREDTTITVGRIEVAARHQPVEGGQLVTAALSTTQLAATTAGRAVRWDEPVSATFTVRRENGAVRIDSLHCESEFLQIHARGTPQRFAASAEFDLGRLASRLGEFVDLAGTELAGTGAAELAWTQPGEERFAMTGSGELAGLRVTLPDGAVWTEPELAAQAEAAGTLDPLTRRPARVDTGRVQLDGQGDALDARLTAAVDLTAEAPAWPVAVRASGSIARWLARVRPWFAADPWQIDGHSELAADIRWAGGAAEAKRAELIVTDLRATAPDWNIHEPRLELAGDVRWDAGSGEVASELVQVVTSTVSLATKDVRYRAGSPEAAGIGQLDGAAAFRADLARLAAWRAAAGEAAPYRPQGAVSGSVVFAQQAEGIRGELTAAGQNLALAQWQSARPGDQPSLASRGVPAPGQAGYHTIWQEPQLRLRGLLNYHSAADRLTLDDFRVESDTLGATASGQIEQLSTTADAKVTGTVDYDLAQITPLLRPYLGEGISLTGKEQARFALAGKLGPMGSPDRSTIQEAPSAIPPVHWSRRIEAQVEAPWGGASVYGLPIGPGKLVATLVDGAIRFEPLSLAVGEGRLTASPHVRLDPAPAELTLPRGPLITRVRISPEVSEAMLKFVAPVLAGATQSEGLFSIELDGARVPLPEARRVEAAGRLTVHSVRVTPGPMTREWIGLAKQVEAIARRREAAAADDRGPGTLLSIRDQHVNFRVADGRVYHDPMEFQVDEVVLRSQGSVGLDETLSLLLTVPIQDRWVEQQRLLAGLRGQSLEIPISGTLTRPRTDGSTVASLSQQLLQTAAQEAVGGELNRALERLFKSR